MATITLTTDTLISTLMPSGGGSLASGDTIQLAGHTLIVDADAVGSPVTIANLGADANLELRDLGRIKLNATLPANVHPWIDPAHPLPVSAEPGIDGDPYRTPLTANARAEIQLAGNFALGGGEASLPTETRSGAWWAKAVSASSDTITFDRDLRLHAGDYIQDVSSYNNVYKVAVVSYDATSYTATLSSTITSSPGHIWVLCAGGFCISRTGGSCNVPIITAKMGAGSVVLFSSQGETGSTGQHEYSSAECSFERFVLATCPDARSTLFSLDGNYRITAGYVGFLFPGKGNATYYNRISIGEVVTCSYYGASPIPFYGNWHIDGGVCLKSDNKNAAITGDGIITLSGFIFADASLVPVVSSSRACLVLHGCTIGETSVSKIIENAGVISIEASLHAPATASDVTWRYSDRTVAPGATIRLRCAWFHVGSAAMRASVAVTDTATWWPSLWPLGADALTSVEFTGGTADWRSELLAWRNTSSEAVQVRVWECVTGTVAGGYLKVEEVKGGQL